VWGVWEGGVGKSVRRRRRRIRTGRRRRRRGKEKDAPAQNQNQNKNQNQKQKQSESESQNQKKEEAPQAPQARQSPPPPPPPRTPPAPPPATYPPPPVPLSFRKHHSSHPHTPRRSCAGTMAEISVAISLADQKAGAFPAAHAAEAAEAEHETEDELSPCEMRFGTSVSVRTSALASPISWAIGCRARTPERES